MQDPLGRIVSVQSGAAHQTAVVAVDASVVCERCASGKGCGAGLYGSKSGGQRLEASVLPDLRVHVGDRVRITLAQSSVLRAALIVYGTPLAGALTLTLLAYLLDFRESVAIVAALVGLAVGIVAAKLRLGTTACMQEFTPVVVETLPIGDTE